MTRENVSFLYLSFVLQASFSFFLLLSLLSLSLLSLLPLSVFSLFLFFLSFFSFSPSFLSLLLFFGGRLGVREWGVMMEGVAWLFRVAVAGLGREIGHVENPASINIRIDY